MSNQNSCTSISQKRRLLEWKTALNDQTQTDKQQQAAFK